MMKVFGIWKPAASRVENTYNRGVLGQKLIIGCNKVAKRWKCSA
jgi:hypothetical protein